jgi:Zn-dependent protease with chaperone function
MPFFVLLLLTLAYLQSNWPAPPAWLTPLGCVLATWLGVAMLVGGAGLQVWHFRRLLAQSPQQCRRWLRRYWSYRRVHVGALVAFYFLAAYLLGWGWIVKNYFTYGRWSVPGAELLILLPFLTGLFLSWARFYDVEEAVHNVHQDAGELVPLLSRWAYVGLQVRQCLILALPPFLLLVLQQIFLGLFPWLQEDALFTPLLSGTLLGLLLVSWPWLLRLLLNLQSLPDGSLRQQLKATARRLSFRHSDILVWDTRDSLATALLAGPLPAPRYVVLTDRLLGHLSPEEVEAVFAHEVGHVKHHHMPLYLIFLVLSLLSLSALWDRVAELLPVQTLDQWAIDHVPWPHFWRANLELLLAGPLLLGLLAYLFGVFGLLSRRCEREADLFAAQVTSAPVIVAALDKVAALNGISPNRPGWLSSWRHDTIARRINCLRQVQVDPHHNTFCRWQICLVKWGVLTALGCLLLLLRLAG